MHPFLLGVRLYPIIWLIAAVISIALGYYFARQRGFAARPTIMTLVLCALSIVVGAKLWFILEHLVFPSDDPLPSGASGLGALLRHGFRLPGGILLMGVLLPLICRASNLPWRKFADAFAPSLGVAVIVTRVGCFLNGCCFGRRTDSWLGLSFPAESKAYEYQLLNGQVAWPETHAHPVHPLQLYFIALGVVMFLLARHWQSTKTFDGEVWLKTYVLFFGGTLLLELMRPNLFHLNLALCVAAIAVAASVSIRLQRVATARASVH